MGTHGLLLSIVQISNDQLGNNKRALKRQGIRAHAMYILYSVFRFFHFVVIVVNDMDAVYAVAFKNKDNQKHANPTAK